MKKRVIIVGIDGGTWDIVKDSLDELPNFKRIIETGCHGNLISTIPCVTASAWTSAFTGVNPGKHGIFAFFKYKNNKRIPVDSSDVEYPYLWETLSKLNMNTIGVAIPFTYPVKKLNGILISGFGTPTAHGDFVYPPEAKKTILEKFPNYYVSPNHTYEGKPHEYKKEIFEIAEQNSELTKFLISKNKDWDLLISVFSSSDWAQHYFWDDKKTILKVYKTIDALIGWLMENVLDDNTHLLLMSDHGFEKKPNLFYINRYLETEGYLKTKKSISKSLLSRFGALRSVLRNYDIFYLRRFIPFSVKEKLPHKKADIVNFDFKNSKAWFPSSSGGGIYVRDKSLLNEIAEKLRSLEDPNTGKKIMSKVWRKEEVYWGPYTNEAPDLILYPNKDYHIVENYNKDYVKAISETDRTADHNIKGMYAVFGADVLNKKTDMFIWDISALALTLLDAPLYGDMDGRVKDEIFKGERASHMKNIKNITSITKRIIRWKHGKKSS